MLRRKFTSRAKFRRWLKSAAGIVITAVTISNGLVEIGNTFDSLPLFQKVAMSEHTNLPKGSYTVEYELKSEETEDQDISYYRTIYAIGYTADEAGEYLVESKATRPGRIWQRLEKGDFKAKQFIVDNIRKLIKLRDQKLTANESSNEVDCTYFEAFEDFVSAGGKNCIIEWRLAQSIAIQINAENIVQGR